jgi:hypothetical protein
VFYFTTDSAGVTVDEHISQFQPLLQVLSAVNQHVQDAVDTCDLKKDDMDQMANLLVDNPAGLVINISVFNELKLGSRVDFDQGMLQYSKVYARGFFGVVWFVVKKWLVDKSNSVILGAPGTGKSTTVWLLCVFLALTDEMEFYYRRRIGGEDHVFILTKDHFKYYETVDAAGNVETWLKNIPRRGAMFRMASSSMTLVPCRIWLLLQGQSLLVMKQTVFTRRF